MFATYVTVLSILAVSLPAISMAAGTNVIGANTPFTIEYCGNRCAVQNKKFLKGKMGIIRGVIGSQNAAKFTLSSDPQSSDTHKLYISSANGPQQVSGSKPLIYASTSKDSLRWTVSNDNVLQPEYFSGEGGTTYKIYDCKDHFEIHGQDDADDLTADKCSAVTLYAHRL